MSNYEIQQTLVSLPSENSGWHKELNQISWFGRDPVYDIRDWNEDHSKMGKGTTFTKSELKSFIEKLQEVSL